MLLNQCCSQLTELFDYLDDVLVWIKDQAGRYCWVNRAFLVNYTLERSADNPQDSLPDVLGKTDYDLSPPFWADQYRLDDDQVLAGNRIVNRIELAGASDEFASWHLTNKIPIRNPEGIIIGTAGLSRRLNQLEKTILPESTFDPVLAYLRDHYQNVITNQQLAQLAHMSVSAFERKFCASFHQTPQKYLRKLRLRLASRALVYTQKTLAEVAVSCGFADQSHFTREFRKHYGRTPRDYRRHYAGEPASPISSPEKG
jgi:AraC-like DNA-binding protein